ncbi:uncharacterized protein N7482_008660 [Penicillium canariense]|uniref:Uncharacterized protein n=1 Tax=Penicillium canariense TaxID=189055 RepID=A0A9W9HWP0_9EURO|nr:uncharacterized protein N7482_008660 [Penicillium canariense]KAJ5157560.1 hypothetical protein N7482_008660 [Penicillium canariense]
MSSSILHQCPFCGHVSDIALALAAFIENPHCAQCGLSVSEGNGKLQDELSALFDRQMTMEQRAPSPSQPDLAASQAPISYSITQHYHHSSHVAPSHPVTTDPAMALHEILVQHGLDPSTLSPAQLDLVRNADPEQQQRLIQTWQLYAMHGQTRTQDLEMNDSEHKGFAEPYMVSGYEATTLPNEPSTGEPYAASTDPVYKSQNWCGSSAGPMESQYGLFEERHRYQTACAGVQPPQWLCPN